MLGFVVEATWLVSISSAERAAGDSARARNAGSYCIFPLEYPRAAEGTSLVANPQQRSRT